MQASFELKKVCALCKQEKMLQYFSKCSASKDGHKGRCKECIKKTAKPKTQEQAKRHSQTYNARNPNKRQEVAKNYYEKNKERLKREARERASHPFNKMKQKEYKERTREDEKYRRKRRRENMNENQKLEKRIRDRFYKVIVRMKKGVKWCSVLKLIGCSIDELKAHLEGQFLDGMSWSNHGIGEDKWNIDHIRPLHTFDLTKIEEQEKAFHFENLRPLWSKDNFTRKENKKVHWLKMQEHYSESFSMPQFSLKH